MKRPKVVLGQSTDLEAKSNQMPNINAHYATIQKMTSTTYMTAQTVI